MNGSRFLFFTCGYGTGRWIAGVLLAGLLAGCVTPQQSPSSSSQSSSSQSSSSSQQPQQPSDSSSSQSSSDSSSGQGSQDSSDSSGGGGSQGSSSSSSSTGSAGDAGISSGAQLPWPSSEGGAAGAEGLDEAFEDSLGDFDESMAGGSGAADEEPIDILSPTGAASNAPPSDQPLFEDSDLTGQSESIENQSVAQRAAAGAPPGASSSEGGQNDGVGSSSDSQGGSSQSQDSSKGGTQGGGGGGGGGSAGASQGNRDSGSIQTSGEVPASEDFDIVPEDIGEGRNDDIVLRQIREAAMNERDPVLREKLWDEYRRIKGSR